MLKSLNLLLIENDAIEVMKFNRALKSLELNHRIIEANNAEEAVDILKTKEIMPDIIILDLNMPKLNGIEFLTFLKADDALKCIPAIILTTSNNHTDVKECYKIGITGYITKPLKYYDYIDRIKKALDYCSTNELISR